MEQYIAEAVAGGASEAEARAVYFKRYGDTLREMGKPKARLSLKEDGAFLLPRLVATRDLAKMQGVLSGPLGKTGLHVTWVRDTEGSVRFLTREDLGALGVKQAELEVLARKNLLKTTPPEMVRGGLTAVVAVARGDTFDAARPLLVPEMLERGEALHAAVPHRDLLILGPLPPGGDWAPVRAAAKATHGRAPPSVPGLLDRPLLVTSDGFELKMTIAEAAPRS